MIKTSFLFPECYVYKEAYCDKCNKPLISSNIQLMSNPPIHVMKCPECNKEYHISEKDIQGYWKWRTV